MNRRQFLCASGIVAAGWPLMAYAAHGRRLPIGFSTLGCPTWDWIKILDFAQQNGFTAVELRGLQGTMDLPPCPEFAPNRIQQSRKDMSKRGLHISCVSSSAAMHNPDPQKQEKQLVDARRFIELAAALRAPYVRVFGDSIVGSREQAIEQVAESLRQVGNYAGQKNVTVLIESHGTFTDSATLRAVLEKANSPHVGLLWDAHHTFVSGKEEPEFTVKQLGKYMRHTHLKDSRPEGNEFHYVLTGRGTVPVKRQVEALVQIGYKGSFSFEWEKVWHPDIEDPEVAIPDYGRVVSQYLKDAYQEKHT
jgi:sugar phosphate isomerase/epimerase